MASWRYLFWIRMVLHECFGDFVQNARAVKKPFWGEVWCGGVNGSTSAQNGFCVARGLGALGRCV